MVVHIARDTCSVYMSGPKGSPSSHGPQHRTTLDAATATPLQKGVTRRLYTNSRVIWPSIVSPSPSIHFTIGPYSTSDLARGNTFISKFVCGISQQWGLVTVSCICVKKSKIISYLASEILVWCVKYWFHVRSCVLWRFCTWRSKQAGMWTLFVVVCFLKRSFCNLWLQIRHDCVHAIFNAIFKVVFNLDFNNMILSHKFICISFM